MAGRTNPQVTLAVIGQSQLTQLYRDLRREANGAIRIKTLRKDLTRAAKPMVPAVRSAILALPSKQQNAELGRKSLRKRMARSVSIQTRFVGRRAGVFVFMNPRKMDDGAKAIPSYFEKADKKAKYSLLRHPVFKRPNRTTVWVEQRVPPQGYFTWATRSTERRAVEAVERVVQRTADSIVRG